MGGVSVSWGRATATTEELVRAHVLEVLGPGRVDVGHLCPLCGSSVHGRPWARHERVEIFVSVSRASGYAVTALSLRGPLGIDIEVINDVAHGWEPSLVLAPGERARTPDEQAWHWAAKEAALKRHGTGLATPMPQVCLADEGELRRIPAPEGLLAVLAPPR